MVPQISIQIGPASLMVIGMSVPAASVAGIVLAVGAAVWLVGGGIYLANRNMSGSKRIEE